MSGKQPVTTRPPIGLIPPPEPDVVDLEIPADSAFFGVVRTAAASMAARLDLTVDRIEDLQIAVDEACTLMLPAVQSLPQQATANCPRTMGSSAIHARFIISDLVLQLEIRGSCGELPRRDDYGWAMLAALVDHAEYERPASTSGAGRACGLIRLSVSGPAR